MLEIILAKFRILISIKILCFYSQKREKGKEGITYLDIIKLFSLRIFRYNFGVLSSSFCFSFHTHLREQMEKVFPVKENHLKEPLIHLST